MCVIEHYQGEPTIKYNGNSALTSVCPTLFNGGKVPFPIDISYTLLSPWGKEAGTDQAGGTEQGPGIALWVRIAKAVLVLGVLPAHLLRQTPP